MPCMKAQGAWSNLGGNGRGRKESAWRALGPQHKGRACKGPCKSANVEAPRLMRLQIKWSRQRSCGQGEHTTKAATPALGLAVRHPAARWAFGGMEGSLETSQCCVWQASDMEPPAQDKPWLRQQSQSPFPSLLLESWPLSLSDSASQATPAPAAATAGRSRQGSRV